MPFFNFPLGPPEVVVRKAISPWRPWMGPIASAFLLALAFEGVWPVVFVALVPLLFCLRNATPRQAWNRGYTFGLLFSLTQLWWLGDLAYRWIGSPVLALVPWLLASLMSAVYYGFLGRLIRSCYALNLLWAIPFVWAGMEVFRSYIPVLAFPWALLGEPLIGSGAFLSWFGTIYLVSAFAIAVNLVPLWPTRRTVYAGTLLAAAFVLFIVWVFRAWQPNGSKKFKTFTIAAGQPGVDMAVDDDPRLVDIKVGKAIEALEREAGSRNVDVLVLPEGVAHGGATIPPNTPFPIPERPALVFGAQRGTGPVYQSAFAHDAKGWTYADKTRLVIFGEFIPGRDVFPFIQTAFHLPGGDLSAGNKLGTLRAERVRIGPLVCFEALFPDLALRQAEAGSEILAVMSIDDWFHPWAKARLARAAQWRAAEAGIPLVRAGSLGRSMIVGADGNVLVDAPMGGREIVVHRGFLGGRDPFPLVTVFPAIALGSLFAVPLLARAAARRRSQSGPLD